MEQTLKHQAEQRIQTILNTSNISNLEKLHLLEQRTNELTQDNYELAQAIKHNNTEIRLLRIQETKLSTVGWNKFKS